MRMRVFSTNFLAALGFVVIALNAVVAQEAKDQKPAGAIEPEDPKLDRPVDFERDVFPILDSKCVACHNLAINENGLNLEHEEHPQRQSGRRSSHRASRKLSVLAGVAALSQRCPRSQQVEATPHAEELRSSGNGSWKGERGMVRQQRHQLARAVTIYSVALTLDSQFATPAAETRSPSVTFPRRAVAGGRSAAADPAQRSTDVRAGSSHRDYVHTTLISGTSGVGRLREVKLWTRSDNVQRLNLAASGGVVPALAISPDDKTLAVAAADNSIKLYSFADGQPGKVLAGHGALVSGLVFSPDGTRLYSSSHDKTVRGTCRRRGAGQIDAGPGQRRGAC
jgi:hypothetical protein